MFLDDIRIGHALHRCGGVFLAGAAVLMTLAASAHAQPRPADDELMDKRLDAFEELFAPHFSTVDRMLDGGLRAYIADRADGIDALGDFEDDLRTHPQVAREYRGLLINAAQRGDWPAVFILETAPRWFLLDIWIEELRHGGEFRDEFLNKMASRDVSAIGTIWKMFEGQSNQEPDYLIYRRYMREHSVEEAAPLIEYLLRAYPLTAMDAMLEFYADQLPDAAAVFDDHWTIKKADWMYNHSMHRGDALPEATAALRRLSRHEVWWVRLYALGAMTERGPFVLRDRVRNLRDDPDDAVSRAANAIGLPGERR